MSTTRAWIYAASYGGALPKLSTAVSDARAFVRWLIDERGVSPRDIYACLSPWPDGLEDAGLRQRGASNADVWESLQALVRDGRDRTETLFGLFNGHGFEVEDDNMEPQPGIVLEGYDGTGGTDHLLYLLRPMQLRVARFMGGRQHLWFIDACRNRTKAMPRDWSNFDGTAATLGRPRPATLHAASDAQVALDGSGFTAAVLDGLRGKGRAKHKVGGGQYAVRFSSLARYVGTRVDRDGQQISRSPPPEEPDLATFAADRVLTTVRVVVAEVPDGLPLSLRLAPDDNPIGELRTELASPGATLMVPPDDYRVALFLGDEPLRRVSPSPSPVDLYQDDTLSFAVAGGLESAALEGSVGVVRFPNLRPGERLLLRSPTGRIFDVGFGETALLPQGTFDIEALTRHVAVSESTLVVNGGPLEAAHQLEYAAAELAEQLLAFGAGATGGGAGDDGPVAIHLAGSDTLLFLCPVPACEVALDRGPWEPVHGGGGVAWIALEAAPGPHLLRYRMSGAVWAVATWVLPGRVTLLAVAHDRRSVPEIRQIALRRGAPGQPEVRLAARLAALQRRIGAWQPIEDGLAPVLAALEAGAVREPVTTLLAAWHAQRSALTDGAVTKWLTRLDDLDIDDVPDVAALRASLRGMVAPSADFAPWLGETAQVTGRGTAPDGLVWTSADHLWSLAAEPISAWRRAHIALLGDGGVLAGAGSLAMSPGRLSDLFDTLAGARHLVVFFDGGVEDDADALALAEDLGRDLEERTAATVLAVTWRARPLDTIAQDVAALVQESRLACALLGVAATCVGLDVAPAAHGWRAPPDDDARSPVGVEVLDWAGLAEELATSDPIRVALAAERTAPHRLLAPLFIHAAFGADDAHAWDAVAAALRDVVSGVLARREGPRWHGWADTLVEELVRVVGDPARFTDVGLRRAALYADTAFRASHGGSQIAAHVAEWLGADVTRGLHVVAHGAGALLAAPFARAVLGAVDATRSLASLTLLAPVCDVDAFEAPLCARIAARRLFVLDDVHESADGASDVYAGSRLRLIAGLGGRALLGIERDLGEATRSAFAVVRAPTASGAAPPDLALSLRHAGLVRDSATRASLAAVIGSLASSATTPPVPPARAEAAFAAWFNAEVPAVDVSGESATPWPDSGNESAAQVLWPLDANSVDYAHLPLDEGPRAPFVLTGAVLARLAALNRFPLIRNDVVLFGLRGCLLAEGDHTEPSPTVTLLEARPDHVRLRCVIGVWRRSTGLVSVFSGSTVPNANFLTAYVAGGANANLLPTGCYPFVSGEHNGKPGMFRMAASMIRVVRPTVGSPVVTVTNRDEFDGPRAIPDNLHPAFKPNAGVEFSSAGCQTVKGSFWDGRHFPPWSLYRSHAGAPKHGVWFDYMLLTGAEARRVAVDPHDTGVTRTRYGSQGSDVEALQALLGVRVDGDFGVGTQGALIAWQRAHQGGRADGIASPAVLAALRVGS